MVTVASIYLRFYIEIGVGVGTFLLTPSPPKIPSDSNSTTPTLTPQPWPRYPDSNPSCEVPFIASYASGC
jgi:hypothetical protein